MMDLPSVSTPIFFDPDAAAAAAAASPPTDSRRSTDIINGFAPDRATSALLDGMTAIHVYLSVFAPVIICALVVLVCGVYSVINTRRTLRRQAIDVADEAAEIAVMDDYHRTKELSSTEVDNPSSHSVS